MTFLKKNIKWDNSSDSWKYLNNWVVNFESTSVSQSSEGETSEPEEDDIAKVEEILERTETLVTTTIQKLRQISS